MFKGIIYIAIGIALFFGYIKYIESRSIFFPLKNLEATPSLINIPFEDVYINIDDNLKINGWLILQSAGKAYKTEARYTILFFHGNAGNISHRLEKIDLLYASNVNIFIIDYRGYGKSQGKPSEKGLYIDAKSAYDYLVKDRKIQPQYIILYGESLGGTAAIDLASKAKVGALIVEGAFSKGRDMAEKLYPFIPSFLFSNKFDSLAKIGKVDAPKLFIHSKTDEIVPLRLAKKLYLTANEPKRLTELSGGHNTSFLDSKEEYISAINSFIKSLR